MRWKGSPTMPDWLLSLTAIVFSGGFLTALIAWRRDKRLGPIEAQTAQVADAVAISAAAAGLAKLNDEREARRDEKLEEQDAKIENLTTLVGSLRHEVARWGYWYSDLTYRWPYHRLQEQPPPPPTTPPADLPPSSPIP